MTDEEINKLVADVAAAMQSGDDTSRDRAMIAVLAHLLKSLERLTVAAEAIARNEMTRAAMVGRVP